MQFYITTFAGDGQNHFDVGRGQHGRALFRPFDDADGGGIEVFAETGIEEFFRTAHAVQIEMHNFDHASADRNRIRFGQGVGWAFDMAAVAGCVQHGARERRFAGAEIAVQVDRQARLKGVRERCA